LEHIPLLNHFSTIFLGEKDGREEQNAGGQQSLRSKGTFWVKHDEQRHPQAANLNRQGIGGYVRSEKRDENAGNDFLRQVIQELSGSR
jgi:hypothetical protein